MSKLTQADIINLKVGCTVEQVMPRSGLAIAPVREVIHVGQIAEIKLPRMLDKPERIMLQRPVTWKTNAGREVTINLQEGHQGFVIAHPAREVQAGQPADSARDCESIFGDILPPNAGGRVPACDSSAVDTRAS